jgi:hypothetical protein
VLPVLIRETGETWPPSIEVRFLDPIPTAGLDPGQALDLARQTWQAMNGTLPKRGMR